MEKFVMLDSHTLPDADFHQEKEILSAAGIECVLATCKNVDEVVEAAKDAEYIGDNYFRITDEVLSRLPKLKAVIRYGIGYDVVDVDACSRRKIALCNLPTYCVEDVATHAIALILDLVRKTTIFDRQVKKGNWDVGYGYATHRMSAKTLGLVGFGNIAKKLCHYAQAFDMQVLAYDPFISVEKIKSFGAKKVELDELLAAADIVSLHVPSTKDTIHMINAANIAKMKDGVIIVNTSRGNLIDNKALSDALASGKVLAAGLDVIEGEPIKDPEHPLVKHDNTVVTPHSAYNSVEASDEQHTQVAKTVVCFSKGEIPFNTVNKAQL
ncbi:C-terminal binding protein [Succinatimonas hippei]|uniref:C-terminal binding protein n=1 Tax=Succinatimonas hippei TaxID=626938 RepID=UPI00255CDC3E|nr:C-terminal binding protein [Succinatimonas hippei]MDM8120932.1 C-terminal binding protein [Succinatimonas hippei]